MRIVWLLSLTVPLSDMNLSRLGICSRSEATPARSGKRWVLSNVIDMTCWMPLLSEQPCVWLFVLAAGCADAVLGTRHCTATSAATDASFISRPIPNPLIAEAPPATHRPYPAPVIRGLEVV